MTFIFWITLVALCIACGYYVAKAQNQEENVELLKVMLSAAKQIIPVEDIKAHKALLELIEMLEKYKWPPTLVEQGIITMYNLIDERNQFAVLYKTIEANKKK